MFTLLTEAPSFTHLGCFCQNIAPSHISTRTVSSLIVQFNIHSIMNFIVSQCNIVLEDGVPFFQNDFIISSTRLGGNKLFEVADCIVWAEIEWVKKDNVKSTNEKENYYRSPTNWSVTDNDFLFYRFLRILCSQSDSITKWEHSRVWRYRKSYLLALNSDLLAESIVTGDLNHFLNCSEGITTNNLKF